MTYLWALLPVLAIGFLFLALGSPRPGILFHTTVAPGFSSSANGRRILRRYRVWGRAILLAFLALGVALIHRGHIRFVPIILPAELAVWCALYYSTVRQTRPFAARPSALRNVYPAQDISLRPVVLGILAALLPLAAASILLHRHWGQIPAAFPVHWDIHGRPNRWSRRTVEAVYAPIWIGASLIFTMLVLAIATRSRRIPTRLRRPAAGILLLASALLGFAFAWVALLPLHPNRISTLSVGAVEMLLIVALVFWSRRSPQHLETPGEARGRTPQKCWYAGLFYFNAKDPSIWVERRFGIGYSLNFARPTSWLLLALILLPVGIFLLR